MKDPGLFGDGGGLYLQVSKSCTKSWLFRFRLNGRSREMGLGSVAVVSPAEARLKAHECRKLLANGIDPVESRKSEAKRRCLEASRAMTFDECAAAYIDSQRAAWRCPKHTSQWINTLNTYASPIIGKMPVRAIDNALVMEILLPIWATKNETASRVRSRLELILAWATVRGYRDGVNPAIWRNQLDKQLPPRSRVQKVRHFAALPFEDIGSFISELQGREGTAARALEFMILTATRTGETLGARWSEFNFGQSLWIIPGERMKAGVEHRVPLSARAIEIIKQMECDEEGEFIFPGGRRGRPLSNVAMLKVIERMGFQVTGHGFRSTFRDWAAERTNFPREVCEQALAHTIQDKVESAYRRTDLLLKRRVLMNAWAEYCRQPLRAGDVLNLSERAF